MSQWSEPSKKIFETADVKNFEKSIAFRELSQALNKIISAVQNVKVPPGVLNPTIVSRDAGVENKSNSDATTLRVDKYQLNVKHLLKVLSDLERTVDETPPVAGPTRFGNIAFRTWHEKVRDVLTSLANLQPPEGLNIDDFLTEAKYYLASSFGSKIRIDYGTGHELSYLAFVGALMRYDIIKSPTGEELLILFSKYYDLVRRLILVYNLEPAGSHGVWGLDDHFHLIYILGASQFCSDPAAPSVRSVLSKEVLDTYKKSNLYVNAISFIFKLKSGPFNEHSPILNDIHVSVFLWTKVRQGLLKMYLVEVLGKFPVIQHFWFGEQLYPWVDVASKKPLPVNSSEETKSTNTNVDQKLNSPGTTAPWAKREYNHSTSYTHVNR
ncbi:RRD1 [Candida margitis]|uniref:RRD1 n=1 Tax=Candida margitis TaxID=1775924 RepID=UPI002225E817|nr:RRD1 [Candida margitis]KAI5967628.1 RRD1 [Candida margitis]